MKDQMIEVTNEYYVLSQRGWASKDLRSSPLPRKLAERIRERLLNEGYRVAILVQVAMVITS